MKKTTLILMKSCLQVTVVLALLGISYVFLRAGLKEYLEGKTDFSYSKQPITPEDVPVMTICIYSNKPLKYGRNIIIKTMATEKTWQNLSLGMNQFDGSNWEVEGKMKKEDGKRNILLKILHRPNYNSKCFWLKITYYQIEGWSGLLEKINPKVLVVL